MTPEQFIKKWRAVELKERSAAQSHFIDLCRMLDEPSPTDADPSGDWYTFERGATKTTGGEGWADVWKRGHFGWEYKGKRKDLNAAFAQLQQYSLALENPPLLVVCDMDRFRIHTNWTNTVSEVHEFDLEALRDAPTRLVLKAVFSDPERLKPGKTRQGLTEEAAARFSELAQRLRERGYASDVVAHFINRLVFCMFAEDVDLLPNKMFQRLLEHSKAQPEEFATLATDLFRAMRLGGRIGFEHVAWFNGGLFNDDVALELNREDIDIALRAAELYWAEIDPSILGTLFERGLDPDKRSQLGAHYTDRDKIMLIVDPVIVQPWLAEWDVAKDQIKKINDKAYQAKSKAVKTKLHGQATKIYREFLDRLRGFRVLDPACGSGNFLYLALLALKDLEHRASIEAEALGLHREFPQIGPVCVRGIELNHYAAELARVSVWIGEIQWMRRNGFGISRDPILKPLDTIERRDAILGPGSSSANWPPADVIVGNPPFLGGKLLRSGLGSEYVDRLFTAYEGKVPAEADYVAYWFAKAWDAIESGSAKRVGFVATNSMRGGANRRILDRISNTGAIFEAWADEAWIVEGAAVRVSIICFSKALEVVPRLNGATVANINSDLTSTVVDLTEVRSLVENQHVAFMGDTKGGKFDVDGELARDWLKLPNNPNGQRNSKVLRPWTNGMDITRRPSGKWIVDFGWSMTESEAAFFEAPFQYIEKHVKPERIKNNREAYRRYWWRHVEPRQGLHRALAGLKRYIITPRVSKHRLFAWMDARVLPDSATIAIARDDDVTFGILHSRFHEMWSLGLGTWLGVGNDPRYTPSTTFETFPFPEGLTPNIPGTRLESDPRGAKISAAARHLVAVRDAWLNPVDLVRKVPEVDPAFPDRLAAIDKSAEAILKTRTLTKLYNDQPTWLKAAHAALDKAVAEAYGWTAEIEDQEAVGLMFALNSSRSGRPVQGDLKVSE